jgi:hypothetical protein
MSNYDESLRITDEEGEETGAEVSVNSILARDEVCLSVLDDREEEITLILTTTDAKRVSQMLLAAAAAD